MKNAIVFNALMRVKSLEKMRQRWIIEMFSVNFVIVFLELDFDPKKLSFSMYDFCQWENKAF